MKKEFVATFVALLVSISANSQLLGSLKLDPKNITSQPSPDTLIRKAIHGSVVIIRQSYQVKNKKNGKVFGRNGRKDFGHNYSIGVKTENGLTLTTGALYPWQYDSAFKKIENDYEPIISLTEVRDVEIDGRNQFSQYPLRINLQRQEVGLWMANAEDMPTNAMEIDIEEGEKDGWIIWYTAKQKVDDKETTDIDIQITNKKINIQSGEVTEVDAPTGNNLVLGGIYVTPQFNGGGHIVLRLTGLVVRDENKWELRTPFVGMLFEQRDSENRQEEQVAIPQETPKEENVDLTPVGSDTKEKKSKKKTKK